MPDIIRLLPDSLANQIAAGEVVQRPASVVKELLENAVDAGSTAIKLIVKDAGKTLVQVIDNGSGMSETDARMCFERHATSKLKTQDDLYAIKTMGFRGEAMASIAAVAQVELRTRKHDSDIGTVVFIENSRVQKQEAENALPGTSVSVKNLFFNVPARKNFLKSNSVELKHIIDEFLHVALAHPAINFTMYHEQEELYHLKSGNLKQRLISCFGKKYDEALVPVEEKTSVLHITGFIGKPETARKTRGEQFFFVNNRYIRSSYLHHAVAASFVDVLQEETYPFYALFFTIEPEKIDINVHPTKTEIKFEDEKSIYAILRVAVKRAINQYHMAPMLNFDNEIAIPIMPDVDEKKRSSVSIGSGRNTITSDPLKQRSRTSTADWDELYKILQQQPEEKQEFKTEELIEADEATQKPVVQLHKKYIVSTIRSGVIIIHQQLAHQRILYEKYLAMADAAESYSQKLLFPEVIHLKGQELELAKSLLPQLNSLGFDTGIFGKDGLIINGVPAELDKVDVKDVVEKMLEEIKNDYSTDEVRRFETLAASIAKNTSVKAGKTLTEDEMKNLIDELFATSSPYFSPDGKPTIITISSDELDKKFMK